jgi:hypothetical protein
LRNGGQLAFLLCAGCDLGATISAVFPDLENAQSIVVATRTDDRLIVEAIDREAALFRVIASDSASIELLAYDQTLDELGLLRGELRPVPGGERLPTPARIYEADVEGDALGDWRLEPEMSAELAGFTVRPPASRCSRFQMVARAETLPTYCSFVFDGSVYTCNAEGLAHLSPEGVEQVPTDPTNIRFEGAAIETAGTVLISGRSAEGPVLWRADLQQDMPLLSPILTSSSGDLMRWLEPGADELFMMSEQGVIERFDGSAPRVVHRFPRDRSICAGIARVREGEAVAVHETFGVAVRYRDGAVRPELIPGADLVHFSAIAHVPELGTVIGSDDGRFYLSDGDTWTELDTSFSLRVLTIVPTADGFLFGGELGHLGEYRRDSGFCETEVVHPHGVWHVREAGGLIYVVNRGDDGVAVMTVLRRI